VILWLQKVLVDKRSCIHKEKLCDFCDVLILEEEELLINDMWIREAMEYIELTSWVNERITSVKDKRSLAKPSMINIVKEWI
jgi:hypothetical protein